MIYKRWWADFFDRRPNLKKKISSGTAVFKMSNNLYKAEYFLIFLILI